jgi:two-component system response regulator ResD
MTRARSSRRGPRDGARGRVLVVEDERTIAEVVSRYLERAGYATRREHEGPQAVAAARTWDPDLIVLDLMLPGFDGLEVMRQLREAEDGSERTARRLGIILLTARGEPSDRITGLRRGADDYVVKPFSPAEIVARVDAVLRRAEPPDAVPPEVIEIDGLTIDPAARSVSVRGDEVVLTAREFDLLLHLASNAGRVFTREQLMESVWRTSFAPDASTVTVHVRRLRAKLETDPARPYYVQTAHRVGYRFRARARTASSTDA